MQANEQLTKYLAKGFYVVHESDSMISMKKDKKFSFLIAIITFFFFFIPFVIYVIWYMAKGDRKITIMKDTGVVSGDTSETGIFLIIGIILLILLVLSVAIPKIAAS